MGEETADGNNIRDGLWNGCTCVVFSLWVGKKAERNDETWRDGTRIQFNPVHSPMARHTRNTFNTRQASRTETPKITENISGSHYALHGLCADLSQDPTGMPGSFAYPTHSCQLPILSSLKQKEGGDGNSIETLWDVADVQKVWGSGIVKPRFID